MRSSIHINHFEVSAVTAGRNPHMPSIVTLEVSERGEDVRFSADEHIWQQVVDQLAALGITASHETTPNVPRLAVAGKFREYQGGAL